MDVCAVRRIAIPLEEGMRAPEAAGTRLRVLLVTGDDDLRAAAARVLEREGCAVLPAAHAGHALLAALTGPVDVLACELWMEDVSGPALADRLRRHHPQLRTLFFANSGTPECEGVVVRPFTRDDMLAGIAAAALTAPSAR